MLCWSDCLFYCLFHQHLMRQRWVRLYYPPISIWCLHLSILENKVLAWLVQYDQTGLYLICCLCWATDSICGQFVNTVECWLGFYKELTLFPNQNGICPWPSKHSHLRADLPPWVKPLLSQAISKTFAYPLCQEVLIKHAPECGVYVRAQC